jgi:hypothetical protein
MCPVPAPCLLDLGTTILGSFYCWRVECNVPIYLDFESNKVYDYQLADATKPGMVRQWHYREGSLFGHARSTPCRKVLDKQCGSMPCSAALIP